MSKEPGKVLRGFYEKDSYWNRSYVKHFWKVPCDEVVPANLKSESITTEWLEEEHNEQLRGIKDAVDRDTFDFVKTIFKDIMVSVQKQVKVKE